MPICRHFSSEPNEAYFSTSIEVSRRKVAARWCICLSEVALLRKAPSYTRAAQVFAASPQKLSPPASGGRALLNAKRREPFRV